MKIQKILLSVLISIVSASSLNSVSFKELSKKTEETFGNVVTEAKKKYKNSID